MFYLLDFSSIHGGTPASYSFLFGRFIVPAIKEIKFVLQRSGKRKKGKWRNVWQIEGNVSSFGLERLTPASKSIFFFSVFCRNKITYRCWLDALFSLSWELALSVKKMKSVLRHGIYHNSNYLSFYLENKKKAVFWWIYLIGWNGY